MNLLRPLPSLGNNERIVSQRFGENPDFYAPLAGHEGIDLACPVGTPVYSMGTDQGIVVETDKMGNKTREKFYGIYVCVEYPACKEFPSGFQIIYAHLRNRTVYHGNLVGIGQYIGETGNTGRSTGPHIHISFIPKNSDRGNGYAGCIDFYSFVDWTGKETQGVKTYDPVSYTNRKYGMNANLPPIGRGKFEDEIVESDTVFGDSKQLFVSASDGLHLRESPNGKSVTLLDYKERVKLLDHELTKDGDNLWAKIGVDGLHGYAASEWLKPVKKIVPESTVFNATKALKVKPEDSTPIAVTKTVASRTVKTGFTGIILLILHQIINGMTSGWLSEILKALLNIAESGG